MFWNQISQLQRSLRHFFANGKAKGMTNFKYCFFVFSIPAWEDSPHVICFLGGLLAQASARVVHPKGWRPCRKLRHDAEMCCGGW